MIVDALINDVTENGLVTKVYGLVDGTIALSQIQNFELKELKHKYAIEAPLSKSFSCVIEKWYQKLILSILPHVLQLGDDSSQTEALEAFPIGHVLIKLK